MSKVCKPGFFFSFPLSLFFLLTRFFSGTGCLSGKNSIDSYSCQLLFSFSFSFNFIFPGWKVALLTVSVLFCMVVLAGLSVLFCRPKPDLEDVE